MEPLHPCPPMFGLYSHTMEVKLPDHQGALADRIQIKSFTVYVLTR